MDKNVLLQKLPPFTNRSITIRNNQTVRDIVKEVLQAHEIFASDYDAIAADFDFGSNTETAKTLFSFLKKNVHYKIESERNQTTKSPAAILETGTGDCKHYAGFIAGVLDALKRAGKKINWHYRFASYNWFDSEPGHVFVVMNEGGKEIWIDPVLKTFNERLEPSYILDKRPKNTIMLSRVSGLGLIQEAEPVLINDLLMQNIVAMPVEEIYQVAMETGDESISPETTKDIAILLKYGVMDASGKVNDTVLETLSNTLPVDEWEAVANARIAMHQAAIGGFFGDVWNGTKKVVLAIPRNAYLALVGVNAFGFASKLKRIIWNSPDNAYRIADYDAGKWQYNQSTRGKLVDKWEGLGGSYQKLENTVIDGMRKKAILGVAPAIPAWVAVASAIIAALTPLITSLLKQRQQEEMNAYPYGVCADGFTPRNPDGSCPSNSNPQSNGTPFMDFVKNNPAIVVGVAAAAAYYFTKPR